METKRDAINLFERGMALIKRGYPVDAVNCFEHVLEMGHKSSACYSWLGVAMARSRWDMARAEEFCRMAVKKDFYIPQYYINLAEVYSLKGNKAKAIETLNAGLKVDGDSKVILKELKKFGARKRPVITFLPRENSMNKYLGRLLSELSLRR